MNSNSSDIHNNLQTVVESNNVVLFMKGEKEIPGCGFSAGAVDMLSSLNVEFESINILSSEELRQAVKKFSNWPTYPQLYVNGELIGGYDIMQDLYSNGELKKILSL